MSKGLMKYGGERIVYDDMKGNIEEHITMNLHLQLYTFAHLFIYDKTVIDAACGTCFGSMLYSTAAKSIICIDKSEEAIEYGKKLPMFCPADYLVRDLNKDTLPKADTCISVETLEHLNGDGFFLKNLNVNRLVFTIPINMPSRDHKLVFKTPEEGVKHITDNGWRITYGIAKETNYDIEILKKGKTRIRGIEIMGVAERYENKRKDKLSKGDITRRWL